MLKFTICFIKQADKILLLNREKPSWMGMWNGVGGKIEPNETPRESIMREVAEETGIILETIEFKGLVTWLVDGIRVGGMYTYLAQLPDNYAYETPVKTDEGILDWKDLNWILNPENRGVAYYIPKCIEKIIHESNCHDYRCVYENGQLIQFETDEVHAGIEYITDHRSLEEQILGRYFEEARGIR
jgi:8-oxo-dGTP diphosphatase